MQKPPNNRPGAPRPLFTSTTDDTQPKRPVASTQPLSKTSVSNAQPVRPVTSSQPSTTPTTTKVKLPQPDGAVAHKPASRHTLRVALATGTTVAALIGAQAVAIFGRTAQAKPVIVGARAGDTETPIPSLVPTQTDVPASSQTLLSSSATPQPSVTSPPSTTPLPSVTSQPSATPLPSGTPIPRVYYTVKSGDTLGVIASRFKTSVQSIMALNVGTLTNSNLVQVGQKLLISGPLPTTPTQTQVPTSTNVPVSPTDSSVGATSLPLDATQVPTWTPWPTSTPIPTWTPAPIQVYRAPVQPAPKTKSS